MSNTTFSMMSLPMLDITLIAYYNLKLKYIDRLNIIMESMQTMEERTSLSNKISMLDELINAIVATKGCLDQNLNG